MTSSERYPISPVTRTVEMVIGSRPNVSGLLSVIDKNPTVLTGILASFDSGIADYNAIPRLDIPEGLSNLPEAKTIAATLPTIEGMLTESSMTVCNSFLHSLARMRVLMRRAEEGEEEPYVGFHIWPGASLEEDRLVGATVQAYGLTVAGSIMGKTASHGDAYHFRDVILDAVLEAMVLDVDKHAGNPLLEASKRLGWFAATKADGSYIFSDKTRQSVNS